jgi:hypothetical protein
MSDDEIVVNVGGEESSTAREESPVATPQNEPGPSFEADRAFAGRNEALNELLDAKRQENVSRQQLLLTKANAAQDAAKRAWDNGDVDEMHARQREAAAFDAERIQFEAVGRRLEATPYLPPDPVEAFIATRDSGTQSWLRKHMDEARVLATGTDPKRAAKLNAADADAIAEGLEPGSKEYFEHVEKFVGLRKRDPEPRRERRSANATDGGDGDDTPKVTLLKRGEQPAPGTRHVKMTKGEYEAATQHLTWGYDDPRGRFRKNDPIGIAEYLRRRGIQDTAPEWQRLPD